MCKKNQHSQWISDNKTESSMLEIIALSILWVVVAALGYRFVRDARAAARVRERQARKSRLPFLERHNYHAVTVAQGRTACASSIQLTGRRFLSRDAPPLPLPGCTMQLCRCRYIHHADRRAEERRFPFGVRKRSEATVAVERRRGDRRKTTDLAFN
jgi:hypothetical protein